jgi:hypothetical protein
MASNTQNLRDTIEFEHNTPVELALKFPTGKIIQARSGQRVMFTTYDERVMFLDLAPAQKVNALGLKVGEKFHICKYRKGNSVEWTAWLSPESEQARAREEHPGMETDIERKLRESIEFANRGKVGEVGNGHYVVPAAGVCGAPAPAVSPGLDTAQRSSSRNPLVDDAYALVDAYAQVVLYASEKHGNLVRAEDARNLLITAYIQRGKHA